MKQTHPNKWLLVLAAPAIAGLIGFGAVGCDDNETREAEPTVTPEPGTADPYGTEPGADPYGTDPAGRTGGLSDPAGGPTTNPAGGGN